MIGSIYRALNASGDLINRYQFISIVASPLRFLRFLDQLVRPSEHLRRTCQAYFLSSLKVDREFDLGRLLHRKIARHGALQHFVNVGGYASVAVPLGPPRSK
jgi:hypothetical protein